MAIIQAVSIPRLCHSLQLKHLSPTVRCFSYFLLQLVLVNHMPTQLVFIISSRCNLALL